MNAGLRRDFQLPAFPFFSLPAAATPGRVCTERERRGERLRNGGHERGGGEKEEEAETLGGSAYVKTAQRRSARRRKQPAHVREADGVRRDRMSE